MFQQYFISPDSICFWRTYLRAYTWIAAFLKLSLVLIVLQLLRSTFKCSAHMLHFSESDPSMITKESRKSIIQFSCGPWEVTGLDVWSMYLNQSSKCRLNYSKHVFELSTRAVHKSLQPHRQRTQKDLASAIKENHLNTGKNFN